MRFGHAVARALIALVLCSAIGLLAPPDARAALKAKIVRGPHGIPTIEAENWKGLGFGYGYAFAKDNICTIAEAYVTANGERSRYFGADGKTPDGFTNLQSDFFFQRIKARHTVEELVSRPAPAGPKRAIERVTKGYVAGYNRYLSKTGVENLPDPRCAGAPWVRRITKMDVYRRWYQLVELASGAVTINGIADAQPPTGGAPPQARSAALPGKPQVERLGEALDHSGFGSNGWALGSGSTKNRSGMVLANPHLPWQGSERMYQSQLVIPGKLNVSGASFFGAPTILIGHTQNLAWTHTTSTAFRFVPVELELAPGDPTSYVVDGQPEQMEADTVTVQTLQPDGSLAPVTRTLYTTRYGPIFTTLQGQSFFAWTPTTAYAMFDSNAENMRALNHFFVTNQAQSTKELLEILRKYQGLPWVNTIAADSEGRALYADIESTPNVPDDKATSCSGALGAITFPAIGLPVLDGSRSACAPGTDADSAAPGIMGASKQPYLFRRDYVANSNDSHWLTNPEEPLEGYPRIIGDERTERSLRTRLGLILLEQRLAGTDGYTGNRFTPGNLRRIMLNNRLYSGELFRTQLAAYCHANPTLIGSGGPVDVSGACAALDGWDEKVNLESAGAVLFRRFMARLGSPPYTQSFDVNDPVHTPLGLDTSDPDVGRALADAVTDLQRAGIPLAAPLGDWQYVEKNVERIPIHGGPGPAGAFNVITTLWDPARGYPNPVHGSTFVMVTSFGKNGKGCPRDLTILTYSQSENPASRFFADQTRMYSRKEWNDPPFCAREVEREAKSVEEIRGG
jgi:acyl-homoserine-lactone acylase